MTKRVIGSYISPGYVPTSAAPPMDILLVGGGSPGMFQSGYSGGGGGEVKVVLNFIPSAPYSPIVPGVGGSTQPSSKSEKTLIGSNAAKLGMTGPFAAYAFGLSAKPGVIGGGGVKQTAGPNGIYVPQFKQYGAQGYFGGGGGGGATSGCGAGGGIGGGGLGANAGQNATCLPGQYFYGAGGGGGGSNGGNTSQAGGCGMVAIRYLATYPAPTLVTGNVYSSIVTTCGSTYRYYAWYPIAGVNRRTSGDGAIWF